MATVEIEFVREAVHPALGECYEIARLVTNDDGSTRRMLRVEPVWSVAARMAEYGVEQEVAVRMVLAAPHVPYEPGTVPPVLGDPLWRRGAAAGRELAEQVVDELGFDALDARVDPGVEHPAAVMLGRPWSADEVSALRMTVADQRQALRERVAEPASSLPPAAGTTGA